MACSLLCSSSGTALIHLRREGARQSSVPPHRNGLGPRAGAGAGRAPRAHSLPEPLLRAVPPASVPHRGNGSGCSTVLSMRVMERGPLCLWPTRRSPGCEIKSGNMHAIKSTWPGLVCIMLERVHVLPCMHPPLPSWWKKCG